MRRISDAIALADFDIRLWCGGGLPATAIPAQELSTVQKLSQRAQASMNAKSIAVSRVFCEDLAAGPAIIIFLLEEFAVVDSRSLRMQQNPTPVEAVSYPDSKHLRARSAAIHLLHTTPDVSKWPTVWVCSKPAADTGRNRILLQRWKPMLPGGQDLESRRRVWQPDCASSRNLGAMEFFSMSGWRWFFSMWRGRVSARLGLTFQLWRRICRGES